jgi:hypothetical protein
MAAPGTTTGNGEEVIHLKDAVGRKFMFPFELVKTWHVGTRQTKHFATVTPICSLLTTRQQGVAELVKSAFVQVDVLGPHVQEEHFDLVGPDGDIILPLTWASRIRPGMAISMTMYDSWPFTIFGADRVSDPNIGGQSRGQRERHLDSSCPARALDLLPRGPASSRQFRFLIHQARQLLLLDTLCESCLGIVQSQRPRKPHSRP